MIIMVLAELWRGMTFQWGARPPAPAPYGGGAPYGGRPALRTRYRVGGVVTDVALAGALYLVGDGVYDRVSGGAAQTAQVQPPGGQPPAGGAPASGAPTGGAPIGTGGAAGAPTGGTQAAARKDIPWEQILTVRTVVRYTGQDADFSARSARGYRRDASFTLITAEDQAATPKEYLIAVMEDTATRRAHETVGRNYAAGDRIRVPRDYAGKRNRPDLPLGDIVSTGTDLFPDGRTVIWAPEDAVVPITVKQLKP